MDNYDIEEILKELKKDDKEIIIESLSKLINRTLNKGAHFESIVHILNSCGINFESEQIENIIARVNSRRLKPNSFSRKVINAIQAIENQIIFHDSTPEEYLDRIQLSPFDYYNLSSNSSLIIRQVAKNMCTIYSSKLQMFHDGYKSIKFGSKSYISLDVQMSSEFISIWLDSTDAERLLGFGWQNNIKSFLDVIAFKTSDLFEIQVAILPPPFDALHVKLIEKK